MAPVQLTTLLLGACGYQLETAVNRNTARFDLLRLQEDLLGKFSGPLRSKRNTDFCCYWTPSRAPKTQACPRRLC